VIILFKDNKTSKVMCDCEDDSIQTFVDTLYDNMKTNVSFIDYSYKNMDKQTKLYKYMKQHEKEPSVKPHFLTEVDFKEFVFEEIRYIKCNQHSTIVRNNEMEKGAVHLIEKYDLSFSVYFAPT
jgi:hypothetical protein